MTQFWNCFPASITAERLNYGEIMSGNIMFWPRFVVPLIVIGPILAFGSGAHAQTITGTITGTIAQTNTLLAQVSAQAGIPFVPAPAPGARAILVSETAEPTESRLCVRAGLGLSVPEISGPQMTLEHGLFGCPTNTGGLPVVVIQDPSLQAPPASRTGEYNLNVTLRYRLLQVKQVQLVASASDQGVAYSLNSPVSGNNLLLAMSLIF
jgi:hypothetical protein